MLDFVIDHGHRPYIHICRWNSPQPVAKIITSEELDRFLNLYRYKNEFQEINQLLLGLSRSFMLNLMEKEQMMTTWEIPNAWWRFILPHQQHPRYSRCLQEILAISGLLGYMKQPQHLKTKLLDLTRGTSEYSLETEFFNQNNLY